MARGSIALLFGRYVLAQMDVPTRQAYVMALVDPEERTSAAAVTKYGPLCRQVGPALAGVSQSIAFGLQFVLAGGIKSLYDLVLWRGRCHFGATPRSPSSTNQHRLCRGPTSG